MVNKKHLRGGAEKMREVAQLLSEWANDLESSLAKKSGRKGADSAPAETQVEVPEETVAESAVPAAVPDEELSYEMVRGFLGNKCAAGFRTQVQALINSFGAQKFSEVDPVHYPALVEAVGLLGGEDHAG